MNDEKEEWRRIAGYPSYEISNYGRLKRIAPGHGTYVGRIYKPHRGGAGKYLNYHISNETGARTFRVNRLVATAFLGPPPSPKHHAAHIDGNMDNNRSSNLKWATARENCRDKIVHGTQCRGETFYRAKLKEKDIPVIRGLWASGISQQKIAKTYGVTQTAIYSVTSRRTWSHVA